jgi:hypothetical protein
VPTMQLTYSVRNQWFYGRCRWRGELPSRVGSSPLAFFCALCALDGGMFPVGVASGGERSPQTACAVSLCRPLPAL